MSEWWVALTAILVAIGCLVFMIAGMKLYVRLILGVLKILFGGDRQ